MKQAKRKFIRTALFAVGVLLAALLTVINVTGFTMAGTDADRLLDRLTGGHGSFIPDASAGTRFSPEGDRFGPMGPTSPEMEKSLRFFTVAFDDAGNAETVAFELSAVSESDAVSWARSLLSGDRGWTKGTYRYRVYRFGDRTYVSVIDQGRELTPVYRILVISACSSSSSCLSSLLRLTTDCG